MLKRALQFDLQKYVDNVKIMLEYWPKTRTGKLRNIDQNPIGIFQIAAVLAAPNTFRSPAGNILNANIGSRRWAPIFVNVQQQSENTVREILQTIPFFNQIDQQQQQKIVQLVLSLNNDMQNAFHNIVPRIEQSKIFSINLIYRLMMIFSRIV